MLIRTQLSLEAKDLTRVSLFVLGQERKTLAMPKHKAPTIAQLATKAANVGPPNIRYDFSCVYIVSSELNRITLLPGMSLTLCYCAAMQCPVE